VTRRGDRVELAGAGPAIDALRALCVAVWSGDVAVLAGAAAWAAATGAG
jgi:hypothetical protein